MAIMATQQADERKPAHGNFIGGRAIQYRKAPRNARTQVWLKRALQLIATTAAGGFLDRFEFDVNLDPSVIGVIPRLNSLSCVAQDGSEDVFVLTIGYRPNIAYPGWQDKMESSMFGFLVELHGFNQFGTRNFRKGNGQVKSAQQSGLSFLALSCP